MEYTFTRFLILFGVGLAFFIIIDTIFLGYLMKAVYQREIGAIARSHNNQLSILLLPGLVVWALIVTGALLFVLPRCADGSLLQSFFWGALYGCILYGVYDLTNYAVLAQWTWRITIVDIAWGTLANGLLLVLLSYVNKLL